MQLDPAATNNHGFIGATLAAAACTLLSSPMQAATSDYLGSAVDLARAWSVDSALAYYREDGRIQAVEPVVAASRTFADDSVLSLDGVFDTLSGSTPNGALTSNHPQTFTSPSGKSFSSRHTYVVAAGQLPVDSSYSDQRVAFSGSWEYPLSRFVRATMGGKFSYEDDFDSVTGTPGRVGRERGLANRAQVQSLPR